MSIHQNITSNTFNSNGSCNCSDFNIQELPLKYKTHTNIDKLFESSTCNVSVQYLVLQRKKTKYR